MILCYVFLFRFTQIILNKFILKIKCSVVIKQRHTSCLIPVGGIVALNFGAILNGSEVVSVTINIILLDSRGLNLYILI